MLVISSRKVVPLLNSQTMKRCTKEGQPVLDFINECLELLCYVKETRTRQTFKISSTAPPPDSPNL